MDLFLPSHELSYNDNCLVREELYNIEKDLNAQDKTQMRGYVYTIHETRDGKRELLGLDHNHIVLTGRRWLMQRAIGGSLADTPGQHEWIINWFGIGQGGANSSDPLNPLYTPDQQEDLVAPMIIQNNYYPDYKYCDDGKKKTFKKFDMKNAQMKYDVINSDVLALFHLVVDLNDCPYELPYLGVKINELALYASPTDDASEIEFVMFSRYCMPTKFKSFNDRYTFLWYIYF